MFEPRYLYRGLRQEEVDAGYKLIAKGVDTFEHPRLPLNLPFRLSEGPTGTVFNHQNGHPTRGVSTSFSIDRAIHYAGCDIVMRIDREKAKELGVQEYEVNKILKPERINKPEDQEVILAWNGTATFTTEIIDTIYKVENSILTPIDGIE